MRKYEDLNLIDRIKAMVLTKLQEFCLKLIIINKGGSEKILSLIDTIYNNLTLAHFKLFYGSDLDSLIKAIKSAEPKQGAFLAKKVLMPMCIRNVKMQCKIDNMYLGRKSSKDLIMLLSSVLLGSLVLNKPQTEVFDLLKEKIESDDARKAS